jgi:ketosteroid isomerase-like protein
LFIAAEYTAVAGTLIDYPPAMTGRTMTGARVAVGILTAGLAACGGSQPAPLASGETARQQVESTERAFARTMADRDLEAFGKFVSPEAVFFSGSDALRGREAVVQSWSRYFTESAAPFSWEPDQVEVLASGTLALSTGPVRDAEGKLIGRFASIWRQEQPGQWRIVFDRGESVPAD